MDRAEFWKVIALVDGDALASFDEGAAIQPLIAELAKREENEIAGFAEQLAQVLYALDGEIYADNAGESGTSGDGFLYARCFVVATGEQSYQRVLEDPAAMPKSLDEWCEPLLSVARDAWAEKTGRDAQDWPFEESVSYETGSNAARWTPREA